MVRKSGVRKLRKSEEIAHRDASTEGTRARAIKGRREIIRRYSARERASERARDKGRWSESARAIERERAREKLEREARERS